MTGRRLLLVVLLAAAGGAARADGGSLKDVCRELAEKAAAAAKDRTVAVGEFAAEESKDFKAVAEAGGAIQAELAAALGRLAHPDGRLVLKGSFYAQRGADGLIEVVVEARLTNLENRDEVQEFKRATGFLGSVVKATDISVLTGASIAFPEKSTGNERRELIPQALPPEPPAPPPVPAASAHVEGSLVLSRPGGKTAVEVRAVPLADFGRAQPAPQPAGLVNGLAFVPLDRNAVYVVRVVNRDTREVAVALKVDGIDQFDFSEDRLPVVGPDGQPARGPDGSPLTRPKFTHYVVAPGGEVTLPGWHKTAQKRPDNILSFLVTGPGEGVGSKFPTKSRGKVGTLTVAVSYTGRPGERSGGAETTFGPPTQVDQKPVERSIGDPHEFISIRYAR